MPIYYIVIAIVVIAIAFLFFNPFKGDDVTEEQTPDNETVQPEAKVVQVEVRHSQPLGAEPAAKTPAGGSVTEKQTEDNFDNVLIAADGQVGDRVMALLKDAQNDIAAGRILSARETLNDVLNMPMNAGVRNNVKRQLTAIADEWLFGRTILYGDNLCSTYKVQPGDMLSQIAKKYNVPYQFIMRINNISSEKSLRVGQNLKVVQGPFHGIVYCSTFTMDLYLQNVYVKSFRVGLGKEGKDTPIGRWRAKLGGKLIKPTWTDPDTGQTFQSDDPNYPLGSGWIALEGIDPRTRGISGIALHGTKDEDSIGTRSSRGCLRLFNGELLEVYNMFEHGKSELRIVE